MFSNQNPDDHVGAMVAVTSVHSMYVFQFAYYADVAMGNHFTAI